jgi:DNA mismatch repair protein MutL
MGKIRILSDEAASQVAAGEVVERPSSIVKELAENSLDAGATRIVVDYAKGGSRMISVRDDGCGMAPDDAVLCLERHATSKIRQAADLQTVRSMGFRGEALPSIASVSRFRLVTREPESSAGTEVLVSGGKLESVKEAGAPPGTLVEARDLFFNLPARKKFLRGEETEAAQILQVMHGVAISSAGVGIECRRDGRVQFSVPPAGSWDVRIRDLFGASFLERLVALQPFVGDGFELSGFVARPGEGRRDRLQQWVVLNGRPVACPEIAQPLREAYAGVLPPGQHPIAVLHLEMDPQLVDCNVHPAKRLVRFARPDSVRRGIFDAARAALSALRVSTAPPATNPRTESPVFRRPEPELLSQPVSKVPPPPRADPIEPVVIPATSEAEAPRDLPAQEGGHQPPLRSSVEDVPFQMLGRVGDHIFVMEGPEGLVLMDVRSARERVTFERLLSQMESGCASCQRLLIPEILELPAREHAWISENLPPLAEAGFLIEPFGGLSLKIEGVPAMAGDRQPSQLLHEIADTLRAAGRLPRGHGLREVVARAVCRSMASQTRSISEVEAAGLLKDLLACELPYAGPFGQPTLIQFSLAELDRKFGRGS